MMLWLKLESQNSKNYTIVSFEGKGREGRTCMFYRSIGFKLRRCFKLTTNG